MCGEYGAKKGTPKEFVPKITQSHNTNPIQIPTIPIKAPAKMKANRNILNENEREYEGIAKDEIPQIETIIIVMCKMSTKNIVYSLYTVFRLT